MPHKLTVTARTIFPPPHQAQIVSEGEAQGRHLDTVGGRSTGPERPTPLQLGPTERRLSGTLRDHVRSASALSALKKSLVANLSAKRQLSVAKLSAKRIFSLAKRDFLVANGRMAADFSSPAKGRIDGCFRDALLLDTHLMIPRREIQLQEVLCTSHSIEQIIDIR